MGRAGVLPADPAQSGVLAILRAAQRRVLAERDHAGHAVDPYSAQRHFRLHRIVVYATGAEEHRDFGHRDRDGRQFHARARHRLCHHPPGDHRDIGCSISSPPHRSRCSASCSASGCSSATRGRPSQLYGTLWILLIAFLTINLPAAYQHLQAAFATIHPELEDASRILGATCAAVAVARSPAPLLRTGVIATWCFIFIGADAGIVGRDHPVHVADQGAQRFDLRSERERRPRCDFSARHRDAGHHLCCRVGGEPDPGVRRGRRRRGCGMAERCTVSSAQDLSG